jgi:TonB family protein
VKSENDEHKQRIREQEALVNVRTLVDKLEDEDRNRTAKAIGFTARVLPIVLVGLGIIVLVVIAIRNKERPNVIPPANLAEYVERVFVKIEKQANTKLLREMDGFAGRVQVAFLVRSNGYIDALQVRESSWNTALDGQATRTVKLSEPFERIPVNLASDPINVTATLRFAQGSGRGASLSIDREPARAAK